MAISEKQHQKNLARKTKKKKKSLEKRKQDSCLSKNKAVIYSTQPVHECLVLDKLFEIGIGNVLISRKALDNCIVVSIFCVDVYCLGIKDAFLRW